MKSYLIGKINTSRESSADLGCRARNNKLICTTFKFNRSIFIVNKNKFFVINYLNVAAKECRYKISVRARYTQ